TNLEDADRTLSNILKLKVHLHGFLIRTKRGSRLGGVPLQFGMRNKTGTQKHTDGQTASP
ncbi:MAG: hypothetical protein RIQ79_2164, partial [Verrucomicrobiota bacterium]